MHIGGLTLSTSPTTSSAILTRAIMAGLFVRMRSCAAAFCVVAALASVPPLDPSTEKLVFFDDVSVRTHVARSARRSELFSRPRNGRSFRRRRRRAR